MTAERPLVPGPWAALPARLRAAGLRWTPQRRLLVDVLRRTEGHITGSELVDRCREVDADTVPSTVYRTLEVLERLGIVRHAHGPDGREEFHVLPERDHGHLRCDRCDGIWEIDADEADELVGAIAAARGFDVELSHLLIVGRCEGCAGTDRG